LNYLNASLSDQNTSGMFVTFFYGVLDTRSGEVEFSNAGHNAPYVVTPNGSIEMLESKGGPMLGLFPNQTYEAAITRLTPGQGIVVFTDGVTEARNAADQFFTEARLEDYLQGRPIEPVELVTGLLQRVNEFAMGVPQADDITALALRYLG